MIDFAQQDNRNNTINTLNIKYTTLYLPASHPLAPNQQSTTAKYMNLLRQKYDKLTTN